MVSGIGWSRTDMSPLRLLNRIIMVSVLLVWVALTVWVLAQSWFSEEPILYIETGSPLALVWLLMTPVTWVLAWSLRGGQRASTEPNVFEMLAEKAGDALLVYKPDGSLLWRNAAARNLFPEDAPIPSGVLSLATRARRGKHIVRQVVPVDGAGRYNIQALPVAGDHTALIVRTVNGEPNRTRFYENFIRRVVHDMRNPLAGIIGHAANLHGVTDTTQIERSAATIESEAQRLARLVDSMLFDARLAYVPLAPEPLDLVELVEEALYSLEERAQTSGKQIALEMPATSTEIEGDRDLLVRAFENLLDNSLKYTGDDGRILVRLVAQNSGYHLAFIDNGAGIPPEYLPHRIFEPFVRVTHGPGGSGLGLSIVKKIIEMHGGDIRAESRVGEGTIISIYLPCRIGGG